VCARAGVVGAPVAHPGALGADCLVQPLSEVSWSKSKYRRGRYWQRTEGGGGQGRRLLGAVGFGKPRTRGHNRRAQKRKEGGLWTTCSRSQSATAPRWQSPSRLGGGAYICLIRRWGGHGQSRAKRAAATGSGDIAPPCVGN
jgi:hypothetical protein